MTNNGITLPPDDAWIERRTYTNPTVQHTQAGEVQGAVEQRIEGTLRGSWPRHGHVKQIASSDRHLTITEVTLQVGVDGSVMPVAADE